MARLIFGGDLITGAAADEPCIITTVNDGTATGNTAGIIVAGKTLDPQARVRLVDGRLPTLFGPDDGTSTLYVQWGAVDDKGHAQAVTGGAEFVPPAPGAELPAPTTGDAGKSVVVNEAEDGYELGAPSGTSGTVGSEIYAVAPLLTAGTGASVFPVLDWGGSTPAGWTTTPSLTGPVGRLVTARLRIDAETGHTGYLLVNLAVGGLNQDWYFDLAEADNPFWMPPLTAGLTEDDNSIYVTVTNNSADDVDVTATLWFQELNAP